MNPVLFFTKFINNRNLLFLIVILLISSGLTFLTIKDQQFSSDLHVSIYGINLKILYLFTAIVVSTNIHSGLIGKQLSNGLKRQYLFVELIYLVIITALIFHTVSYCTYSIYTAYYPPYKANLTYLTVLPFISFLCYGVIAALLAAYLKHPIIAGVAAYFLPDLDSIITMILTRFYDLRFSIFPHGVSQSLIDFSKSTEIGVHLSLTILYILLFTRLLYKRVVNMDFD